MNKISSDLYRYTKQRKILIGIKTFLINPRFKYTVYMRISSKIYKTKILKFILMPILKINLRRIGYKCGLQIPYKTNIDEGLYIVHWGDIVINPNCKIGKNLTISQGVTIGQVNRGKSKGTPIIGNNVYIGPGAKIIGSINIGNNVAIGANAVVTKDIPDNAVVVGIPAKVISYEGSKGYIHNEC